MYLVKATLTILIGLLSLSCSPVPPSGYWVSEGPYKGTLKANRDYIRPYHQCVDMGSLLNKECK